jgi:hypothetical protein
MSEMLSELGPYFLVLNPPNSQCFVFFLLRKLISQNWQNFVEKRHLTLEGKEKKPYLIILISQNISIAKYIKFSIKCFLLTNIGRGVGKWEG